MTTATAARKAARPIDKPIRTKAAFAEAVAELDALIDQNPREVPGNMTEWTFSLS